MLLLSLIRSCRMVILTFSERKNRGLLFQNGTGKTKEHDSTRDLGACLCSMLMLMYFYRVSN